MSFFQYYSRPCLSRISFTHAQAEAAAHPAEVTVRAAVQVTAARVTAVKAIAVKIIPATTKAALTVQVITVLIKIQVIRQAVPIITQAVMAHTLILSLLSEEAFSDSRVKVPEVLIRPDQVTTRVMVPAIIRVTVLSASKAG